MWRYAGPNRRMLLGAALCLPGWAQANPALPSFAQNGRQFVFLSPSRAAPDAALTTSDGKTISLLEPGSRRPSLLYFGATWCPPCRSELSAIESRLKTPGPYPRVMAIMMDQGGAGVVGPFLQRSGLKRPVALDPQHRVAKTAAAADAGDPFVLWALPVSYVLSPGNRIVGYLPGAIDWTRPDIAQFFRAVANLD